jgi:hypothetical protein
MEQSDVSLNITVYVYKNSKHASNGNEHVCSVIEQDD